MNVTVNGCGRRGPDLHKVDLCWLIKKGEVKCNLVKYPSFGTHGALQILYKACKDPAAQLECRVLCGSSLRTRSGRCEPMVSCAARKGRTESLILTIQQHKKLSQSQGKKYEEGNPDLALHHIKIKKKSERYYKHGI